MVDKEDVGSNSMAPCQLSGGRKTFWRSASWSTSRNGSHNPREEGRECVDPDGNVVNSTGQNRRFPAPLMPRSLQNCKGRSCLPPLQPLSIARRSVDEWPKASSDDVGEWLQPSTPSGRGSGDRLKLDLSTIQRTPDKNSGLVKRDKIASFDKECSKVAEHIYLGGDVVARDRDILKQNGITHVLNCVGFVCSEYFKADFVYRTLWLQDSPSEDITSILYDVFDYFEDVREKAGRVFVHCCQGVSRSTSLVIAYLMWREGQSFDDAFQYVKAARGIADPNMGFACQLLQCQKRVHAFPLSPSSLLRMYRLAPHSPYDPLHLVPKMLNDPSPSALDSRGAFIVHAPSAIYVWIGKDCEVIMERDARGAVCQIVRYERVQGPIVMMREGEEPSYFWDIFSSLLPLMDKSGNGAEVGEAATKCRPGEKKVASYNIDFEIFQKAIMGGVVPPFASSENEHETCLPARESCWSVLRRKFAPGNMKEFVSAPKVSLSRVYSDSRIIVHSSGNSSPYSSLPVSAASLLSSPPFLSPDSVSSDSSSSSKYFSESSLDSPLTSSCSLPVSSTLSNFSNFSLSSKTSTQLQSNSAENHGVNVTQQPPQSSLSPFKRCSPSIAERRGSLSQSLKLPVKNDKTRAKITPQSHLAGQEDVFRINNNSCSLRETDDIEICHESKDDACNEKGHSTQHGGVSDAASPHKEATFFQNCSETWRNPSGECSVSTVSNDTKESDSSKFNQMQLLVCRWPSLEKIATFGASDLDSKAAFTIFAPSKGLGTNEEMILYMWIGKSFTHDSISSQLDNSIDLGESGEMDWYKVGFNVLTQLGLPNPTVIKVIEEQKEPDEFFAVLSS